MALPQTTELWGTFSTRDHRRTKPFVADVILYDKLVIPYPSNDSERQYWLNKKWNPARQKDCLDILGNLAVPIPWNDARRQLFQERQALASDLDPFFNTSLMLKLELDMGVPKECVPPENVAIRPVAAYPSRATFEKRWSVEVKRRRSPAQPGPLSVILGRKFLVPKDQALDDLKALEKVAELARDPEFIQQRSNYHQWLERVIREGFTEADAVADMRKHVDACNRVIQ
jgi:hypothetical protein